MSPKIRTTPLSYLCLKAVANQVIYALSDDEGLNYETVGKYLSETTFPVLEDLLKYILAIENLDAATRFSCLQLLLAEHTKVLETGIFPYSYYERILNLVTNKGSGLQHLNLKGVWVHDQPELLKELLGKLRELRVLVMPHIAADFVLEIAADCDKLVVLDVAGDCGFSARALSALKSTSIKVLDIGSYGKRALCGLESDCVGVLVDVIQNLPNLTVLRTYSFVGPALLQIYRRNPKYKTKFIYLHDTRTTTEMYEAIANLCPNLLSVYFDTPQDTVVHMLTQLKSLKCLKLARFNYNELVNYLRRCESDIETLKLSHCNDCGIDLSSICSLAPSLTNLDCFKLKLTVMDPDCYFMNLRSLDILYCDVSDCVVRYVLTNSPFLRRVVVGDVIKLTDGDIFRLCAQCDFVCLEELWFSCAGYLTATSVQLLMGHCPALRSLGQLSGWDVSSAEFDYLKACIASSNTDLALHPQFFP